ncbi:hypothetical protein WN51_05947 [Melipona quadrifasciata]|uniref:Uncharacterized protein n=1 Tax=Melipona quadrifasciata TaxID=166423 RepID=A0A0M9A8J4_9HYME|nr:hypothetical protein WN51_05947 [Melipona quadrifasciata]
MEEVEAKGTRRREKLFFDVAPRIREEAVVRTWVILGLVISAIKGFRQRATLNDRDACFSGLWASCRHDRGTFDLHTFRYSTAYAPDESLSNGTAAAVISYRQVQKKKKATNYCIRFGHSLWSANQLLAQRVKDKNFCAARSELRVVTNDSDNRKYRIYKKSDDRKKIRTGLNFLIEAYTYEIETCKIKSRSPPEHTTVLLHIEVFILEKQWHSRFNISNEKEKKIEKFVTIENCSFILAQMSEINPTESSLWAVRHKDAFYTLSGPRQVLHTTLATGLLPTRTYVDREGRAEREREENEANGVDGGGHRRHGREKRRRDGYVGTSSTSHGASSLDGKYVISTELPMMYFLRWKTRKRMVLMSDEERTSLEMKYVQFIFMRR